MGGGSSKEGRQVRHFYFKQVTKKKSYNKEFITVTTPIRSKDDFDEWKQRYQIVQSMIHKESLYLPDDFEFKKMQKSGANCGCCGAQGQTKMTYEQIQFLLSSELINRKSKKSFYEEPELLFIMYKLLEGSKEFQKKQISLGDIRPKNMLVTKEGDIKMVNIATFPQERNSVQKEIQNFDHTTIFYFAPQEVDYLKKKGYSSGKETFPNPKTEAFSIGLSILEAATLQNSEDLYKMPSRQLNTSKMDARLKEVSRKYPMLYQFLSNILKMDSSQRMSSGECWASMRVYSEKIADLQPFKRKINEENQSIRKFFAGVSSTKS